MQSFINETPGLCKLGLKCCNERIVSGFLQNPVYNLDFFAHIDPVIIRHINIMASIICRYVSAHLLMNIDKFLVQNIYVCVPVLMCVLGPIIVAVICFLLPATVITVVDIVLGALQTQATRPSGRPPEFFVCACSIIFFFTCICLCMSFCPVCMQLISGHMSRPVQLCVNCSCYKVLVPAVFAWYLRCECLLYCCLNICLRAFVCVCVCLEGYNCYKRSKVEMMTVKQRGKQRSVRRTKSQS